MNYKKLGNTDLTVSPVCFGGNVFGWTLDEKASLRMLDELFEQGINFIDTANNYSHWAVGNSGGESEAIIGKWFKESRKRHDVVLSTKVGGRLVDKFQGLKKANIMQCVDDSLRRLNTDYIDLYFSHHDDLTTPVEETIEAFNLLIKAGKVRYLGASNLEVDRIIESNDYASSKDLNLYSTLQPLYNLYDRQKFETEYLPLVEEQGFAVMSYFALASGFLSGKYKSIADLEGSARKSMVEGYFDERGMRILDTLKQIATTYSASMTEIAIAWQLHKSYITTPIVSATTQEQLASLINSTRITLSIEDIQQLELASAY